MGLPGFTSDSVDGLKLANGVSHGLFLITLNLLLMDRRFV